MAVQDDAKSSSERKSGDGNEDLPIFNAENLQINVKSLYYSRTFLSIVGGVVAGIWGFTGLTGFVFYFLVMALTSLGLLAKANFSTGNYFDSWNRIALDGFFGGLMVCFLEYLVACSRLYSVPS
ncbi:hypothetical protein AXF42_Ash012330 [Apostasia shenzhenica]|uniref:ER membrane protein complex subunit 6 n=1 Tax=Apostasia shenzhenica TaxID=1088818 RepID=A0A2I0ACV8_9ASPA|nr:hypothetical protein AXF42_Ash012330 [Apostasia shenzhenica]